MSDGVGNNSRGWFAVARATRDHPVVGFGKPVPPHNIDRGAFSRAEAWQDLLALARYVAGREYDKGQVVALAVGQLLAGREWLAKRWNWSEKTVRGFLDKLEAEDMISRCSTEKSLAPRWPRAGPDIETGPATGSKKRQGKANNTSVITIRNYEKYQLAKEPCDAGSVAVPGTQKGQQRASAGPARGQTLTKATKEPRKIYPDGVQSDVLADRRGAQPKRTYSERFEKHFWNAYPDRMNNSKSKAAEEFEKLDAADQEAAVASLLRFSAYCKSNPDYRCLHAERYLRERRFESFAETAGPSYWWKDKRQLAATSNAGWREKLEKHANGTWPVDKLGPPPQDPNCVVPREIIEDLGLKDKYDHNGIAVGAH